MSVGKTKNAGWQIGVSRTVPVDRATAWGFLLGGGLPLWLGVKTLGAPGSAYEGTLARGEVRSLTERVRVRLTYHPTDGSGESTVQLGFRDARRGTTLVFHQERLAGAEERERARAHWLAVADAVEAALTEGRAD